MSVVAPPPVSPPSPEELEALIREARERQLRRRLLGAAAVAIAAAVGLGLYALWISGSPRAGPRPGTNPHAVSSLPHCSSGQLLLSAPTMWGAAAGSLIEPLTVTNTSNTACTVAGWPAVRRLDRTKRVIPVELSRWVYAESGPAPFHVVKLRPGDTATFPVFGQDWNHQADRDCPDGRVVQVKPPGGRGWLSVTLGTLIPACQAWYLGPFVAGRSAPWPSYALSQFYTTPGARRPFYSGDLNGVKWRLRVRDGGDGRYCLNVFTGGSLRASRCGRFYMPGPNGSPVRLAWISKRRGALPNFVAGAVISAAKQVAIRLSNGSVSDLRTMPPNRFLAPGISFFFTTTPHGTYPVSITAHDRLDRVVTAWKRRVKAS